MRFYNAVASVRRVMRTCTHHTLVCKIVKKHQGVRSKIEESEDFDPHEAFVARLGIPAGVNFMKTAFPGASQHTVSPRTNTRQLPRT